MPTGLACRAFWDTCRCVPGPSRSPITSGLPKEGGARRLVVDAAGVGLRLPPVPGQWPLSVGRRAGGCGGKSTIIGGPPSCAHGLRKGTL